MGRLQDKVVLITGAGSGIGRCAAMLFAREGASVVVAEFDRSTGAETAREIGAAGGLASFVHTDVTDEDSVAGAVRHAITTYGRLTTLYNNAGGSSSADGPVTQVPMEEFWRALRLDLLGTWLVCRHGIPELIKAGGGAVINSTSVVASIGWPGKDAYTVAKGGIVALTRSMAVEFGQHNVRVNAVMPCTTRTPRVLAQLAADPTTQAQAEKHLLGLAEPIDIAQAALYLASDESRRTTGHILAVDSGLTIS